MKVQLIGHDEKYALEQSLLTLFPDERPVYGAVEDADTRWAVVTMVEETTPSASQVSSATTAKRPSKAILIPSPVRTTSARGSAATHSV